MSLHRVSSLESFAILPTDQRSRRSSDASARARKLSFNPLPQEWDPTPTLDQAHAHAVGAFEVPRWKRLLQVAASVFYCLFASGIVFGFAAIKPVLKSEGAYRDLCSASDSPVSEDTCIEIHLNLMYTVAAVAANVVALPIGAILDHHGPRVCGLVGSCFLAVGALFMAFENKLPFDGLLLGYLFLSLGGPFTYISSFQLSNAFPKNSGLILALLTGAFDASSAVFLAYRILYQWSEGSFGHRRFFMIYLIVPVVIVVLQLTLMPAQSYKTVGELVEEIEEPLPSPEPYDQIDEETALLQEEERQHRADVISGIQEVLGSAKADKQAKREERKNEISGVWGVMHAHTAWEQIKSPWYIFICLFTVVQMTRINYFITTVRAQYEAMLGSHDQAVQINNFFDAALPLGGIISIPFIGMILDRTSTVAVLTVLVTCATAIGLLGIVPNIVAGYANICLFVLYRPFYYTAVSDYTAKVFGFRTFGTVYGTIIFLSGLFNFSQSGLDILFHQTFHGNPVPVNIGLLSLGLTIGVCMITFVWLQAKGIRRKNLGHEAETAFSSPRWD